MQMLKKLWNDEFGVLLSAEAVVVGTVAVVGMTAGMSVVATSVNEELKDVAGALRSLDQSYIIPAQSGCGASTAGSSFTQAPVKESLHELSQIFEKEKKAEKTQAQRLRQQMKKQKKQDIEDSEDDTSAALENAADTEVAQ